jgi:pSer/pThr/pTyr-binding forkhead associated (FHA) protein
VNFATREPPSEERAVCALCGSRNHKSVRFCVTCGHLLAQGSSSAARDSGHPKPTASGPPAAPAPPAAIAPMRVVELSDPAPAAVRAYVCPRCRGLCEGPGQFCRFCGHSLADAPLAAMRSEPEAARTDAELVQPRDAPGQGEARGERGERGETVGSTIPIQPLAPFRYRLVVVARDGGEGPTYPVGDSTDIGRTEGDIVISDDEYVSPRHARIFLRGGAHYVRDLGSTNGVFVRIPFDGHQGHQGRRSEEVASAKASHSEHPLADQDLFLVGQQVLRFEVVKHADEGFGVASENGTLLFGTPATPRYARITQRTVEGVVRDVFHVRKAEMVIGRESGDIVFTDDPFLSRRHAVLRVHGLDKPGGLHTFGLEDLGSSNGTFLQIRDEVRLQQGTHFRIGQQLFRFDSDPQRAGA